MNMPVVAFDTLEYAKELELAGIPIEQAEALARAQAKVFSGLVRDQLATKDDIRNMATKDDIRDMATKDDIRGLDIRLTHLESVVDKLYLKIVVTLGSMMVAGIAVLGFIDKF